jgi:hypothetical protein
VEKVSWTDRLRNEEVLHRVKEERNILHTIKIRKANWIGHILRRNCLVKPVIEGKIEGTRRGGRRRKQLPNDFKEKRRYWKSTEEALDRTMWRTRLGSVYGPVVRETAEWVKWSSTYLYCCWLSSSGFNEQVWRGVYCTGFCPGGVQFEFRLGNQLSWLRIFVVFLSPFSRCRTTKQGYDHSFSHSLFTDVSNFWLCSVLCADSVWNNYK